MHARTEPTRHRFVHRVFMLAVDLDELPIVHRVSPLFSVNRRNFYSIREDDYLPVNEPVHNGSAENGRNSPQQRRGNPESDPVPPQSGLKARVVAWLGTHGIDLTGGRVELLTMPRIAGFSFNPVSFYFCFDAAGRAAAAIAEVTNTFREVKPYLLGPSEWRDGAFRLRVPKHFYVSPFSDVDVAFDFELRPPERRLSIRIDDYTSGRRTLATTLTGATRPLTGRSMAWYTVKHPLLTLAVMALIHGHALALALKRTPWFSKAGRPADQRDLYRPNASILGKSPAAEPAIGLRDPIVESGRTSTGSLNRVTTPTSLLS